MPDFTHLVKRLYNNDEYRIPLIRAGWEGKIMVAAIWQVKDGRP